MLMRAIATARKSSSFRVLAFALNQLASTQLNLGKLEEAGQNVEEALRIAELNNYDERIPFIRVTRALVHEANDRMDEAHRDLELATSLTHQLDNPLAAVYVQNILAKHYGQKGLWDRAIPLLEASLAQARTSQIAFLQVGALETLALLYEAKGEYSQATEQWNSLLELSQEADMPLFAAEAHVRLALLYERNEEIEAAISQLEEAHASS